MKRTAALLLALCLLLSACKGQPAPTEPTTAPTTEPPTVATTVPVTEPPTEPTTEPPTESPTEPVLLYQHPITGEPMAELMENRPVAVVINNISQAQPLHGIGQADALFEIVAEGGGSITRCLAIFTDLENVPVIGSVRSARTYLIDLARAFQAPLVHCGGSEFALEELSTSRYNSINEFYNGDYFYRDKDRLASGYSREHTLFTTGPDLLAALEHHNFDMTNEGGKDFGLIFANEIDLAGEPANTIELHFYEDGKATVMTYDEASGNYFGEQHWRISGSKEYNLTEPIADANTEEDVPFRNVFILRARTTTNGYRMFATLTGEGTGYYACNGEIVPILWKRDKLTQPFTYTLEDGTPLTVGVGKSYIGVIPGNSPVTYE